jgi:hypothetical protein
MTRTNSFLGFANVALAATPLFAVIAFLSTLPH